MLANDTDAEGDSLTAVLVTGASHGNLALESDGTFSYTHDGSETTSDSLTYLANDGTSDSNTVTVSITVVQADDAVDDAPVSTVDEGVDEGCGCASGARSTTGVWALVLAVLAGRRGGGPRRNPRALTPPQS